MCVCKTLCPQLHAYPLSCDSHPLLKQILSYCVEAFQILIVMFISFHNITPKVQLTSEAKH